MPSELVATRFAFIMGIVRVMGVALVAGWLMGFDEVAAAARCSRHPSLVACWECWVKGVRLMAYRANKYTN